ncbi:MAG: hypothetical protein J6K95_03700 [Rikenellaceae bacterium]|nr:hypothetical protein [Rikenellaceae bacterium]
MNTEDNFRELLRRSAGPKAAMPASLEADIMRQVRMRAAARRQAEAERPQQLKNLLTLAGVALLVAAVVTLCYLWVAREWPDQAGYSTDLSDYLQWAPALTVAATGLALAAKMAMNVKLENSNNN